MSAHSTIRLGSKGVDVIAWQKIVGVTADGDFGPKTLEATRRWQASHGLTDDGVVGPQTWEKAGASGAGSGGEREAPAEDQNNSVPAGGLIYPLYKRAVLDFHGGARYFGARRSGGKRLHGGIDLIAPHMWKIRAIADGTVIQAPYYFYSNTYALEVHHPGVGTVRYGEIAKKYPIKLAAGTKVRAGQHIAYVGLLASGSHMLHFELYSGKGKGGLTVRGNKPYQRRSDVMNPAKLMEKLEKLTF